MTTVNYLTNKEMASGVIIILQRVNVGEFLDFSTLKDKVEKEKKGIIADDALLEDVLKDMKGRRVLSYNNYNHIRMS